MSDPSACTGAPIGAPVEPVLDMHDIQGLVVPGFLKKHRSLVYVRFPVRPTALARVRKALHAFAGNVSTAHETLEDRRRFRDTGAGGRAATPALLTAIAFTSQGLRKLVPGSVEIPGLAFQGGMAARSALLGDPTDPTEEGHPDRWEVGGTHTGLDAMLDIAGDERGAVSDLAAVHCHALLQAGAWVAVQEGDIRPDRPGFEHFGFNDGISQPGIRGRASSRPTDFITERHIDPTQVPAAWLNGYPGQDLLWPGEFVIGYPASGPDPLVPGKTNAASPPWTRNGSFLAYRRLRQDVALFWRTMRDEAKRLSAKPGFEGTTDVDLASRLVGRWPSGAPLSRTPDADLPALGNQPLANNQFFFESPTSSVVLKDGFEDVHPNAMPDPLGTRCPLAAHVRKVNLRDSASDMGGRSTTFTRRLLRVGIAFGEPLPDPLGGAPDPLGGDRGLLFMSIQASIEQQFEFVQARWINDHARPRNPSGHDMIVGQNAPIRDGIRRCTLFGDQLQVEEVTAEHQWIIPTGGGYFFVPSLSALTGLILCDSKGGEPIGADADDATAGA